MSKESIFISTSLFLTSRIILLTLMISWICKHTCGNRYPPFQIVAVLPSESGPQISRELRRALAEWEVSKHSSFTSNSVVSAANSASDISLFVSPIPITNDSQRIITTICSALEANNPSVMLSLVDESRNFYAALIAESVSLPILSFTQQYKLESWPEVCLKCLNIYFHGIQSIRVSNPKNSIQFYSIPLNLKFM